MSRARRCNAKGDSSGYVCGEFGRHRIGLSRTFQYLATVSADAGRAVLACSCFAQTVATLCYSIMVYCEKDSATTRASIPSDWLGASILVFAHLPVFSVVGGPPRFAALFQSAIDRAGRRGTTTHYSKCHMGPIHAPPHPVGQPTHAPAQYSWLHSRSHAGDRPQATVNACMTPAPYAPLLAAPADNVSALRAWRCTPPGHLAACAPPCTGSREMRTGSRLGRNKTMSGLSGLCLMRVLLCQTCIACTRGEQDRVSESTGQSRFSHVCMLFGRSGAWIDAAGHSP